MWHFYHSQHASMSGDQLDLVEAAPYDVVFLTIGGNDLAFGEIVGSCLLAAPYSGRGCEERFSASRRMLDPDGVSSFRSEDKETFRQALSGLLQDIAARLHPGARIVYLGYPSLVDRDDPWFCADTKCKVTTSDFDEAYQLLNTRQAQAVADANAALGGRVEVIPVLDVGSRLNVKPPYMGLFTRYDAGLWDPIDTIRPGSFPPGSLERLVARDFNNVFTSGYYHPNRETYQREANLVDTFGGANLFGATISEELGVMLDPISGAIGTDIEAAAHDNVPGDKIYEWDFNGDGVIDDATDTPSTTFRPDAWIVGTARVTVTSGGDAFTAAAPIAVTDDGDLVPAEEDNCPLVANGDQNDLDADDIGDACDPDYPPALASFRLPAGAHGDPHMVTFDGLKYDLQAVGEFHLVRDLTRGVDVQIRYRPVTSSASSWSALATKAGSSRIEVNSSLEVLIDGARVNESTILLPDASIIKRSDQVVNIYGRSGIWLQATREGVGAKIASSSSTVGLLGNNNDDIGDDLRTSSGDRVDPSDTRQIHERFADSWRIDQDESLFTYAEGESTATFTDKTFPETVKTLADFSSADLEAAASQCRSHGVADGTQLDDCTFDVLVTGDAEWSIQAAINSSVAVDPTAARFSVDGVLEQRFDGSVASTFAHPNYLALSASDRAAGPVTTDVPYQAAVVGVPRHDQATIALDLVVKGDVTDPARAKLAVDGSTTLVVELGDSPAVVSGPDGAEVAAPVAGTTVDGSPYQRYRVSLPAQHFGSALRFRVTPQDWPSGPMLGVDNVKVVLVTAPAQVFPTQVPFTPDEVDPAHGSGRLESPGAEDDYTFAVEGSGGTASLLLEIGCELPVHLELYDSAGSRMAPADNWCTHRLFKDLPNGNYRLEVTGLGSAVPYSFRVMMQPAAEPFGIAVGDTIAEGVPAAGAGRLETSASEDVYRFTVAEGGQTVVFDGSGLVINDSSLVQESTGNDLGGVFGHREYALEAGDYTVHVRSHRYMPTGTYSLHVFAQPPSEVFSYQVGQRVEDGKIGGQSVIGAGRLETTASKDVYQFSLAEEQTVVFDSLPGYTIMDGSRLVSATTGHDYGYLSGHREFTLPAGDYEITVRTPGTAASYWLESVVKPAAQVFDYQIGQRVEDGKIGGQSVAGAGRLETTASKDVYNFTVAAEQTVVFDSLPGYTIMDGSRLVGLDSSTDYGVLTGHRVFRLPAGRYQITVAKTAASGTYWFTSFVDPSAQLFTYQVGQMVENGKIGGITVPGAGNLETTASTDIYSFSLDAAKKVVFDSLPGYTVMDGSRLRGLDSDTDYGVLTGHHEFDLPAGDYQITVSKPGSSGTYWLNTFVKPEVQVFDYRIGQKIEQNKIDGQAAPGAGNVETTASKDVYNFSLDNPGTAVFDSLPGYTIMDGSRLKSVSTGTDYGVLTGHREFNLPAGDYQITVEKTGATGTYWLSSFLKPAPQAFEYEVGQKVENGKVNGANMPGAGNLETTASKDVYRFSVATDELVVFDGDGYWTGLGGSHLIRTATGQDLGPLDGHREYLLLAGDYEIVVEKTGWSGTYAFTSFHKPLAQVFQLSVGDKVQNGKVNGVEVPGAGNLETSASKDVYSFTLDADQTVVFDGDAYWTVLGTSRLIRVIDNVDLGRIDGHHELQLTAGAYRIEVEKPGSTGTYWFAMSRHVPAGAIRDKWYISGGPGGVLGTPAADQACTADVCWQDFQGGQIMSSGATAWITVDPVRQYWVAAGGPSSALGLPTSDWVLLRDGGGGQVFQNATVYQVRGKGVFSVAPPIRNAWGALNYQDGALGYPVSERQCDQPSAVCWQDFEGGEIMSAVGGAWTTSEPSRMYWVETGGPAGSLGPPVTGWVPLRNGRGGQVFQNGNIYVFANGEAHSVTAPIRDAYAAVNYQDGALGYPVSERQCDQPSGVCWQDFEGGEIMSAGSTAWTTSDDIRTRWLDNGGPTGDLGKPTSGLEIYSSGTGQGFTGGSIFWSQATGAHAVYLKIRAVYSANGWYGGTYGYPTAEQTCTSTECSQTFQRGTITVPV